MLTVLWYLALGLTLAGVAYLLLALASVAAYRPARPGVWPVAPSVTLLKPLCGDEKGLEAAIGSFLGQRTKSRVRFVFGAADPADPALAVAREVAARFAEAETLFVADPALHGPNPKISNLINMAKAGLDDVIALSDSDAAIGEGDLQRAIDALARPDVGAVTALHRSRPGVPGDTWRTFGGWFLDYWFLPMTVLHARLGLFSVTYGQLTLVKRDVLERIGGLAALADHLSDDSELGRLVREAGYEVGFTPDIAETLVNDASHAELFDHELRWARTVRGLTMPGFTASVVSHPGPLPLLLLIQPGWLALAGICALPLLRWCLVCLVEAKFGRAEGLPRPGPIAIWLRDCYCFAVWAAAFAVGSVGWRGRRLGVERGDILQPLPEQTR